MKSYLSNLVVSEAELSSSEKKQGALELNAVLNKYREGVGVPKDYSVKFTSIDPDGNLYKFEKGVKILLPGTEIQSNGKVPSVETRSMLMNQLYKVRVLSIDESDESMPVVCVSARKASLSMKQELLADIKKATKSSPMVLPARVTKIDDMNGYALVDLCGVGVVGVVGRKEWAKGYTGNLSEEVKNGAVIYVKVTGEKRGLASGRVAFVASRRDVVDNPFKGVEKMYPVGTLVTLKAVQLMPHHFFGRIDGLEGVDVFCAYPNDKHFGEYARDLRIIQGHTYAARVSYVSEADQKLRARVYAAIKSDEVTDVTRKMVQDVINEELASVGADREAFVAPVEETV